jgi:hypothetical protein
MEEIHFEYTYTPGKKSQGSKKYGQQLSCFIVQEAKPIRIVLKVNIMVAKRPCRSPIPLAQL